MSEFPQEKQTKLFIPGPVGQLEAIVTWPEQTVQPIVGVVCHPHPLYEGSMHNKVVTTVAGTFDRLGVPSVRFNYRGVGASDGSYGEMVGETQDLLAVIDWVQTRLPDHALWLAGFSFGAFIASSAANQLQPTQLMTIAPAVNHADFSQFDQIACPWLVVQGDKDEVVPPEEVFAWAANPPSPLELQVMRDAGHFFHGRLIELREVLTAWLVED